MNVGLPKPVDPPAAPQKQALDEAEIKSFASFGSGCLALLIGSRRSLGEPIRDIADDALKQALANFEHQLDAFEARTEYQPKASQPPCLASTDPRRTFHSHNASYFLLRLSDRISSRNGLNASHTFCGNNARLHAKGEGEDNRWRGGGARHRGMACRLRIGVAVRRIN